MTGGKPRALQACLQTDPALRPTCRELLAFPYFAAAPSWFSPEFHRHQVCPDHDPAARSPHQLHGRLVIAAPPFHHLPSWLT